ncbi:hypothetical protein NLU13_9707 [Sarocladium strictum]|uniref:Uncharacterized protein n=1 Tax=Sarocladium strictum TaxID=5046 RepID=A0AA39GAY9_SARSR|nr:hypothetical protein NLU13_9707 [Sarocladium strictum]
MTSSLTTAAPKPRKSLSKRSLLAKPFKISQLDGSAPRRAEIRVIKRKASIELIAEQYQAFLESRDAGEEETPEISTDGCELEPIPLPALQEAPVLLQPSRFNPFDYGTGLERRRDDAECRSPSASPASSTETLVDFEAVESEADVIYFKPVSLPSSQPARSRSRSTGCDKPLPRPPPSAGPLQKCVSLVVDELSTTMPLPKSGGGSNTRSLEINTMIEVYERVRGQLDSSGMGCPEQDSVRSMFDCWLAALHTMHHRSYADDVLSEQSAQRRQRPSRRIDHQRGMSAAMV